MNDLAIKISHVSKEYRLGMIGGATLRGELQSRLAKLRGKEDPNLKIGAKAHGKNERFLALNDINLEIRKGERIGIIGHNGAGKSTLLKLICRVTAPSSGEIRMNGRVTSMLEVGTGFHGELTGRENIYLNGAILGLSRPEIDKRFDEIVEFSEVGQFIDTPVKRYSSGMHVKLGFAVASHLDSEIMIMDEVLAVGDMAFQKKCIDRMRLAAEDEGRTILYVSHNMRTIRQLCDRCIVLEHGRIVFDGEPEKAISIYMANEDASQFRQSWDLSKVVKNHALDSENITFTRFDFAGEGGYNVPRGNKLAFSFGVDSEKRCDSLIFRAIFSTTDGNMVGMSDTSDTVLTVEPGENTFEAVCDTSALAPGAYLLKIELCIRKELGGDVLCEAVGELIYFAVVDEHISESGMEWNRNWWGFCDFGKISVRPVGRSD